MALDWNKLQTAPAQSKPDVSPSVGTPKKLSKKKDTVNYTLSSFYVLRKVNNRFDRALLELKDHGLKLERSEVLEALMDAFAEKIADQVEGLLGEADIRTFNAAIGRVMHSVELSAELADGSVVSTENPHRSGG